MVTKLSALVRQLEVRSKATKGTKAKSSIQVDAKVAEAFRASAKFLGYKRPTDFIESLLVHYLTTNGDKTIKEYLQQRAERNGK